LTERESSASDALDQTGIPLARRIEGGIMETMTDTAKQRIVRNLTNAICANVDNLYTGKINHTGFGEMQRAIWSVAEMLELSDLLRSTLLDNASQKAT